MPSSIGRPRLRQVPSPQDAPAPADGPRPVPPEVTTINVRTGDKLVVEPGHRTEYDFYGRNGYYLMSRELSARLPMLGLNATQYDLLHLMMGIQERGGIVTQTQAKLAEALGIHRTEIVKAMRLLLELGLIWQEKRGVYRINPRCAFYGRSGEQIEAVQAIPEHVPDLNLPDYTARPPRRRRQLKGVKE